ncbi:hypothetical protein [Pseudofrankia inefficax]|nr:hypothetical protein [Pseudofrankia inefficax]
MVDVERYSEQSNRRQVDIQTSLAKMRTRALRRAQINHRACAVQEQGDGFLLVLPAGIDEARAVPGLVNGFVDGLTVANEASTHRIRLRAALAQGVVRRGATGYVANAVVAAARIVGAAEVRAALDRHPDRDLAFAVTAELYSDVIADGYTPTVGTEATQAHIDIPDRAFSADVWILVPDAAVPSPDRRGPNWERVLTVAEGALSAIQFGQAAEQYWDHHLADHHQDAQQQDDQHTAHPAANPGDVPVPSDPPPTAEPTDLPVPPVDLPHETWTLDQLGTEYTHLGPEYTLEFDEAGYHWLDAPYGYGTHEHPGPVLDVDPHSHGPVDDWPLPGTDHDGLDPGHLH